MLSKGDSQTEDRGHLHSLGPGWDLRFSVANELPGDAHAARPETTRSVPRSRTYSKTKTAVFLRYFRGDRDIKPEKLRC